MTRSRGNLQKFNIPAPVGGMNRREPIHRIPLTQAYLLKNYYPFHQHIRGAYKLNTFNSNLTEPRAMTNWFKDDFEEVLIVVTDDGANIGLYSIDSSGTETDITNSIAQSANDPAQSVQFFTFADNLFLVNLSINSDIIKITRDLTASLAGFTGPGSDDKLLIQGWGYKGRIYFIEGAQRNVLFVHNFPLTTSYWYHATIGAVTGALTEIDLAPVMNEPGGLLAGATFGGSQGGYNEELCCFFTTAGEVLIYSGDYPGATNWELATRLKIPPPLGRRAFTKIGSDLAILTSEGVIFLSTAISQNATPGPLFTITDSIRRYWEHERFYPLALTDDTNLLDNNYMILDPDRPFLYIQAVPEVYVDGDDGVLDIDIPIFVLNLRTGAFSVLGDQNTTFVDMACAFGYLHRSDSNDLIHQIKGVSSSVSRVWKSGWYDLGSRAQKFIRHVKLYCGHTDEDDNATSSTTYTLKIYASFKNPAGADPNVRSATGTNGATAGSDLLDVTEFEIGIAGIWFQFEITATGGGLDEISELEIDFETGGYL